MFNIIIYTYMIYVQDHLGTNVSTRVVFTCLGPTVRLGVRFNASTVAFVLNISDAGTVSINIYIYNMGVVTSECNILEKGHS